MRKLFVAITLVLVSAATALPQTTITDLKRGNERE